MGHTVKGQGKGIDWIRAHVGYQGDECLIWPYSRDWQGYGNFGYMGKMYRVSRFMCEEAKGAPPADKPFALHTCGNGHQACSNPNHLYWGTAGDNQQDTIVHGTAKRPGGRRQKLSDAQVEEIRALAASGMKQYQIAGRYGVRRESIGQILRGAWRKGKRPELNRLFNPAERSAITARILEMRRTGMKLREIAPHFKVSVATILRLQNEARTAHQQDGQTTEKSGG